MTLKESKKGGDKMGEMVESKEQHKIRKIEEVACKLANTVGNTLGRANAINKFFFGVPEDSTKSEAGESGSQGWLEGHVRVLQCIEDRVQDIYSALGNIHEVVDKK